MATTVSGFTTTTTWTVPANITSVTAECWGGGGASGAAQGSPCTTGGAAGGSYARSVLTVVPGNVLTVTVGAGGLAVSNASGNTGGVSWFSGATVIYAQGGAGSATVTANSANGAPGVGSTGSTIGTVKYRGGSGATGDFTATTGYSGGGGGGPGSTEAGRDAIQISGGTASSDIGGSGGLGVRDNIGGNVGNIYGGGASGGKANGNTNRQGANGAAGYVRLTWSTARRIIHVY